MIGWYKNYKGKEKMRPKRKKPITVFFPKLPQLLLAGVLFSAGMAACLGISIAVALLTGFNNIILWGVGIIPGMLFYAGLVTVIRKYAIENDYVPVVPTFFKAVRENWKAFLLHGFVVYAICSCSLFATMYYYALAQEDITYGYVMSLYGVFTAALLIMMFYVPVMTVTYELRWRDIYKNSLLMIIGKILRNLLTLLMIAALVALAILIIVYTGGFGRIVACVLIGATFPMIMTYIEIAMVSKGLIENVGDFVDPIPVEEDPVIFDDTNTEDDYIFVNGRMVKNPNKK